MLPNLASSPLAMDPLRRPLSRRIPNLVLLFPLSASSPPGFFAELKGNIRGPLSPDEMSEGYSSVFEFDPSQEDEICRGPIGAEEAIRRHAAFRRSFRSSPPPAASGSGEHLIAAVLQLLRRGLDRSAPGSPMKKPAGMVPASGASLSLPGAC